MIEFFKEAGIIASIIAIFFYLLKRWLEKYMDSKFSENTEVKNALLEIQKERLKKYEEKKDFIYPEIYELVYRLKNQLRDLIKNEDQNIENDDQFSPFYRGELGQDLYFLTENLYKYRAYIDNETFDKLHRYKRILQDARVLINLVTRPEFDDKFSTPSERVKIEKKRYLDSAPDFKRMLSEIEILFDEITRQLKEHIEININKIKNLP